MQKYTELPWGFGKVGNNYDQWMVYDNSGKTIAIILDGKPKAALFAAAPELMESLEETLKCLESWMEIADDDDRRDYDYEAVKKARSVLEEIKQ